ncbi:MAG: hypothetical protein K6U04_01045 [Armatimonadetes bacterium]|nr:hypothetical protein [Armatimonadota bacterium]
MANSLAGRVLTFERVLELNSKDWFYRVLKENPEMESIYPGIENDLLKNAIDMHIHAYPDFVTRSQDMIEVSIDAARAEMRAVAFKDHYNLTAGAAYLTQRYIDQLYEKGEIPRATSVYGGIGLNFGMRPDVVKIALKYPNMKMIWFPTFNSAGYLRSAGKGEGGVALVDKKQKVLPEVEEIMHMAKEAKVGIGLGHTDFYELLPLCAKAKEIGARVVLDHPLLELNKLTLAEMKECAGYGAYIGTYCQPMIPSLYQPVADPFETVTTIKEIGAERCIIGSDFGQVLHVKTVEGIRIFIRALLAFGIKKEEIEMMIKDNPAKLMYLD